MRYIRYALYTYLIGLGIYIIKKGNSNLSPDSIHKFDMQNIEMDKLQYKIYHENKIHTPDDFPYNTYLCSIPLDFQSVNLHWHDEVEIIVIKKEAVLSV